ncbi:MAG: hypothetical protein WCX28_10415 [Bacteriovoracaceae bacterium]
MNTKSNDGIVARNLHTGVLAIFSMIGASMVLFVVDDVVHGFDATGIIVYVLYELLAATACFFIIRKNPRSIWYVSIITNALLKVASFVEPNFWINPPEASGIPVWIPVSSGWI